MTKGKATQEKRASRRARRRQIWIAGGALAVMAAGVTAYFAYRAAATQPGVAYPSQGNLHIEAVTTPHGEYNTDPPTSGPHLPYIAPWGVHTTPIPRELQVHNLEDGGVVVQYNCQCPELVARLKAIVQRFDRQVLLAPYPGMKSKIALTAWGRLDQLEEFDEARILRFIDAYRGIDHHPAG
jgi:uncharacterized protein DUF3105